MIIQGEQYVVKKKNISAKTLKRLLNVWPPLFFTGIKVLSIQEDFKHAKVKMALRFYNKNFVGTQFGGNLYAMTDPFYMIMVVKVLGSNYYVWDQAANIIFKSPGKGDVYATFELKDEDIKEIISHTSTGDKYIKAF